MSESESTAMSDNQKELRSLALTPTWSVASVLTTFVFVSLLVERSIHHLGNVSDVSYLFGIWYLLHTKTINLVWHYVIISVKSALNQNSLFSFLHTILQLRFWTIVIKFYQVDITVKSH